MATNRSRLTRDDFAFFHTIPLRWNDNDMLGHVNNVVYYSYLEAVVVEFNIRALGVDWATAPVVPYTAENLCRYRRALAFPDTIEGALGVARIGRTSVTYQLGLFRAGEPHPAADGHWVHVWVDRRSERPVETPPDIRAALEAHTVGRS